MALKLGYWKMGGRAEPIRMLLHILGQEYENVLYTKVEDWFATKQKRTEEGGAFFNIPYLPTWKTETLSSQSQQPSPTTSPRSSRVTSTGRTFWTPPGSSRSTASSMTSTML